LNPMLHLIPKAMKELNRDNMKSGSVRLRVTVTIRNTGGLDFSKYACALLDIPHYGFKIFEAGDSRIFISSSDDNNAFRARLKTTGALMQNVSLARHIINLCGTNLRSVTLEISDKADSDGKYEINLNPLRSKKGAPA